MSIRGGITRRFEKELPCVDSSRNHTSIREGITPVTIRAKESHTTRAKESPLQPPHLSNQFDKPLSPIMDDKHYKIPTLTRDNWENWFRQMRYKLESKETYYTVQVTKEQYAWVARAQGSTTTTDSGEPEIDRLSTSLERLCGTWN